MGSPRHNDQPVRPDVRFPEDVLPASLILGGMGSLSLPAARAALWLEGLCNPPAHVQKKEDTGSLLIGV